MDSLISVRRATPADLELVTTIVEVSVTPGPLGSHPLCSLAMVERRPFWRLFVEGMLRYRWIWLVDGGRATSLWVPPGGTEMSPEQEEGPGPLARPRRARDGG